MGHSDGPLVLFAALLLFAHVPVPSLTPHPPAASGRYADNILYAYAKPSAIVVTTVLSCALAGGLPSPSLLLGVSLVVGSIFLYSSKPKSKVA